MVNIYDKTHELAAIIKECDEYKNYITLKEAVEKDDTTKALLKEYKQLQMQLQAAYMSGTEMDADSSEKFKKLGEVLQFNKEVAEYLMAEHRFYTLIGDIYKILGDAAQVDLGFMEG